MSSDDAVPPPSSGDVKPITIEEEMKRSYLDYAMSVIVSRALPDVRDGLKPVHRRILYAMHEIGLDASKGYRKSAVVVGDVMGKYHPHGDLAIYDALVRMAQTFSMRLPLVDGQGNFGSVDGDPPAAMRYTECRLTKAAGALLADIEKSTVDFQANYDGREREPTVLPARFPNLLVNGAGGIAVGMATNIPPHNLGEVVDAAIAYIENPQITPEGLIEIVPGPDFPTGGIILGHAGARSGLLRGRGSVVIRGRASVEEIRKDREAIIITEIPYQVNKSAMIEKIADLVRDKKIEGISDLRDESDRRGMRVVVELKRDAQADIVLNQLYRFSPLQTTFGVNMLALDGGRPEVLTLKRMIEAFVGFREEVVTRRTKFDLTKARDRAHVLVGLAIAVTNIDEVIRLIRASPDPATAREALMGRSWPAHEMAPYIALIADPKSRLDDKNELRLSDEQARAILDLRLNRLTALGAEEIGEELKKLRVEIEDYLDILRSRPRLLGIIRDELKAVREEFATPRRTTIVETEIEVDDEDLIQPEEMAVTVTHAGYIKRVPLSEYRLQRRGGKGRAGMAMKEEDFVIRLFVANTHVPVLFFSSTGMVYKLKVWRLPEGSPQARGKAMVNLLPLAEGERITTVMPLPEDEGQWGSLHIMFATKSGHVRRNELSDFTNVMANGKIAMKLEGASDGIVGVQICTDRDDVLLTTRQAKAIRFPVPEVRVFKGRESMGVRGIRLQEGDEVVSMSVLRHVEASPAEARAYLRQAATLRRAAAAEGAEPAEEPVAETDAAEEAEEAVLTPERYAELGAQEQFILTVTEKGFGKRTAAYHYRAMGRGGQGVIAMDVGPRTGGIVASFPVEESDQIMLVTDGGQLIRCPVAEISLQSRGTRGVTIFRTAEDEKVVSVEHVPDVGEEAGEEG